MDPRGWERMEAPWLVEMFAMAEESGKTWTEGVINAHMRFLTSQRRLWLKQEAEGVPAEVRVGLRKMPGCRELAAVWRVSSKNAAAAFMKAEAAWWDPRWDTSGTAPGQSKDTSGTVPYGPIDYLALFRDESGTVSGHPWDTSGNTRVGFTSPRLHVSTSENSPLSLDEPATPPAPDLVLWEAYREHQRKAVPPVVRAKKPAKGWPLKATIAAYGLDGAMDLVGWAHLSGDGRARALRGENSRSTVYLGETIFRKRDEYAPFVSAWVERGRQDERSVPTAQPADPTGDVFTEVAKHNRRSDPPRGLGGEWTTHPDPGWHDRFVRALEAEACRPYTAAWEWWCNLNDGDRRWREKDIRQRMRAVAA